MGDLEHGEVFSRRALEQIASDPPGSLTLLVPLILSDHVRGVFDNLDLCEESARNDLSSTTATPLDTMEAQIALALIAIYREDGDSAPSPESSSLQAASASSATANRTGKTHRDLPNLTFICNLPKLVGRQGAGED